MNMSMEFKKVHNKILVDMKTYDVTIDLILVHFGTSKLGLYVSFRIPLYLNSKAEFCQIFRSFFGQWSFKQLLF